MSLGTHLLMAGAGLLLFSGAALAEGVPPRIRATIQTVSGDLLGLQASSGQMVEVKLAPNVVVAGLTYAKLDEIKPNSYVGIATMTQKDGTLVAVAVQVFPEAMRGMGDGHYPWDLGESSTMTNGAVGSFEGSNGRTMTVKYKGGEKQILVPESVPVVGVEPADRKLLTPGAHVVVFTPEPATNPKTAGFIFVGEGVIPPI